MMKMSRESRKIIDLLNSIANESDVQGIITPAHIYICDSLVMKYYTQPMMNIIRSKFKGISKSKREWKHFTIEYWEPIINSMIQHNTSANKEYIGMIYPISDGATTNMSAICGALLTDYSIQDTYKIHGICNKYTHEMILDAIKVATSQNAVNVAYISAVLENSQALADNKHRRMEQLIEKTEKSDIILDKEVRKHSVLELAQMEYNYNERSENAKIEQMFINMFGGIDNVED